MSRWEEIFARIFRGGLRRGTSVGLRAAPEGARSHVEAVAGQVARSTFRIFRNNLLALPWIREWEELDAASDGARADLLRSWNAYRESAKSRRSSAQADADWRRVVGDFRRHVADLNRRIAAYNLKAPSQTFCKSPLDAEREIRQVMRDAQG
jgi:hypothetical protein